MRMGRMLAVAAGGILAAAGVSQAVVIAPGSTPPAVAPTNFASVNGTVLGSITGAPISPPTPHGDTGTYTTEVLRDTGTGFLDFVYMVNASSANPDVLVRLSSFDFTGFVTDVGYTNTLNGTALGGTPIAPTTADRNSNSTVGFNFALPAGTSSDWLVIKTNANSFGALPNNIGLSNGGTTNLAGFSPVPNPATVWGGAGLFGLLLVGRLRRKQTA